MSVCDVREQIIKSCEHKYLSYSSKAQMNRGLSMRHDDMYWQLATWFDAKADYYKSRMRMFKRMSVYDFVPYFISQRGA